MSLSPSNCTTSTSSTTTTTAPTTTTTTTTTTLLACNPVDCDDGLRCTDDTCDPFTGVCNHVFDPAN